MSKAILQRRPLVKKILEGADDNLLPTRKGQPAPDLKYFNQPRR